MDDADPYSILWTFLILLLFDVFVFGAQAAIQFIREEEIEKRLKAKPSDRRSLLLQRLSDQPRVTTYTVYLYAAITLLVAGLIHVPLLARLLMTLFSLPEGGAQAAMTILALFLLMWLTVSFGITLPRRIAAHHPAGWAYGTVDVLYAWILLLTPLRLLCTGSARLLMRLFGLKDDLAEQDVTEEEIRSMVEEGQEQGVLQESEADMITNIFEFSDKEAQEIMTHRGEIVAIEEKTTLQDAVNFMLEGNNSRFPVYKENIDHIVGILHIRDAMKRHAQHDADFTPVAKISGLLRQAEFVPETRHIDALFAGMKDAQTQIAIVVDEYGQTSGLISMEDILEEIVGNILDEYDEDEAYIEETANEDEFIIDGKTPLEELEKRFGMSLEDETCETVNGLMIARLDRIPADDEQFDTDIGGYNFRILSVSGHVIQSVLVRRLKEEE
ncbi:MAG: HlyC/CorC family transporter [Lachnospiraceae bacterium]|nr:HlyC/CorC family transporter [Lachnospiraceae bacterium]